MCDIVRTRAVVTGVAGGIGGAVARVLAEDPSVQILGTDLTVKGLASMSESLFSNFIIGKEPFTWKGVSKGIWRFFRSDLAEKVQNVVHFRKLLKELWGLGKRHGKGFAVFATISWLCDDFIAPAVLWALQCKAAAAFVFFMHFEWITWPSYFLAAAIVHRTLRKKMNPQEYALLLKRVQKSILEENTLAGRIKLSRELLKSSGPYVMGVFFTDLAKEFDPETASSASRIGPREQAAKYMGRSLRDVGIKTSSGKMVLRLLQTRVDDKDPWVRKVTISAFAKFGNRLDAGQKLTAYQMIRHHMHREQEPEEMVRGAAARACAAFLSEQALMDLARMVEDRQEHGWPKKYAAESIGRILSSLGYDWTLPPSLIVRRALDVLVRGTAPSLESKVDVRCACLAALAQFPSGRLMPPYQGIREELDRCLTRGLSDPDPTAREVALWGIARTRMGRNTAVDRRALNETLMRVLGGTDPNLAELAYRYLRVVCRSQFRSITEEAAGLIEAHRTPHAREKKLTLIAVEELYEPGSGKVYQLDSPKVQELADALKQRGHCVCYSRNFLLDRVTSPMGADGSIDIFNSFDTPLFSKTVGDLRKGMVTRVPRIDFRRGRVAGARTIVPSRTGDVVVLGSAAELLELGRSIGMENPSVLTPASAGL